MAGCALSDFLKRLVRRRTKLAIAATLLLTNTACAISQTPSADGLYSKPFGGAPVVDNPTDYSKELRCVGDEIARNVTTTPTFAIGYIPDYTGKFDFDGAKVTQGAGLMAMSAFAKLNLPLVERSDMAIAESELRFANNNLIGENGGVRLIRAGSLPGSDYFLAGGITEINYNIRSSALEGFYKSAGVGGRLYVLNVAIDLRLVETRTLKVVEVISYQKQVIGRELQAGVFEFFGDNIFDLSAKDRALEPIQLAVRAMIEKASAELARRLFKLDPTVCQHADGQVGSRNEDNATRG